MEVQPPPYNAQQAPQQGYVQPAQGQPAYAQPGYAQPAYGQPAYGQPHGYPPTAAPHQPQTHTVVVAGGGGTGNTIVVERAPRVNHILHLIITILFWPWVFVWIILCLTA